MKKKFREDLLIKNCVIIGREPEGELSDILVADGKIADIGVAGSLTADPNVTVYDAAGAFASPAFIDIHTHLRDPGFTYKEDIASGTAAAAAGGYGTVVPMPNTKPVTDNEETLRYVLDTAEKNGSCRVAPAAAITHGQKGDTVTDFSSLSACGAVAFSDDGRPVAEYDVMLSAMKQAAEKDVLIISHSEELEITGKGVINESETSRSLGLEGIPNASEDKAVEREIEICRKTGARLHIAHVSTAKSADLIRQAKKEGLPVTGETCPHYFVFTDEDVKILGTNGKMKPPLRSDADRTAVIEAVVDGTLDCISTDHAPHAPHEKLDLVTGAFGITGLQSVFAAAYTTFVKTGKLTLSELVYRMSTAPAKVLGFTDGRGALTVGGVADVVILNGEEFILSEADIKSKSKNTPFIGMKLNGKILATFVGGQKTY